MTCTVAGLRSVPLVLSLSLILIYFRRARHAVKRHAVWQYRNQSCSLVRPADSVWGEDWGWGVVNARKHHFSVSSIYRHSRYADDCVSKILTAQTHTTNRVLINEHFYNVTGILFHIVSHVCIISSARAVLALGRGQRQSACSLNYVTIAYRSLFTVLK